MKIVNVEAIEIEGVLETPWKIATATMKTLNAVLVRITADDGTIGYGEACARRGTSATKAVIDELLAPVVLGRDGFAIEAIWNDMYGTLRTRGHSRGFLLEAISGIDIALWDMLGRHLGLPISRLMAGCGRTQIPAYASSILIDTPEAMANKAAELKKEGYNAIKIKVAGDLSEDINRIEAVRREIGPETKLMLDANSGFDPADAIALAQEALKRGVYWLEEPIFLDSLPGYRRVRNGTPIRIAAGEGEFSSAGFREFLREGLLDVVQPNITRAGGFTECRRIAALAQSFGVPIAPHTGASGPICRAATMQLSAALSGFLTFEHMFLENPFRDFFVERLPEPVNSVIDVPQGPGLGVEVATDRLSKFVRTPSSS